jgi:hypothetical protein
LIRDDAPQFKVFGFIHGLCWVPGEQKIDRLIPLTAAQRRAKEQAQTTFWETHESLKHYRLNPTLDQRQAIEPRFDQ